MIKTLNCFDCELEDGSPQCPYCLVRLKDVEARETKKRFYKEFELDMVQPDDPRFKFLYPEQYKINQKAKEVEEQRKLLDKKNIDILYKDAHTLERKKMVTNTLKLEEKLNL